jgi:hypothetical protein
MKVTVELDDIWIDGESTLTDEINHLVKEKVKKEIWDNIKEHANSVITKVVQDEIEKDLLIKGQKMVSEIIENGRVPSPSSTIGDEETRTCTLEELIKYKFKANSGWSNPDEKIKNLAKTFGNEMKSRYDLLFASQLVAKMNENGLLKEDAAKKLLE